MMMIEPRAKLTPPDPKKKLVNEMLRHVEALIRSKDLAKAFLEIQRARAIDDRNPYIKAFEERLTVLIEEKKKTDREASMHPVTVPVIPPEEQKEVPSAVNTTAPPLSARPDAGSAHRTETVDPARRSHSMVQVRSNAKSARRTPLVVIVDDDKDLLPVLREVIVLNGLECMAFDTTDAAYGHLQQHAPPDIIVCDINLESSTMGGFSFYEKLHADDKFSSVPFIFLSGLSDEAVIRTGKELGADDYLTKPISEEMLISTIKGKLRRFERLQQKVR